jgi:hypothetical protein
MRQNQPSYYPFDAKSVEFLPAEDATMPPIPLVRAAFGVPVLKVLRAIGVAEAEFRRVGIPIYAEPTPITLMPEKPWWELLGNVSRREEIADLGSNVVCFRGAA